MDEKIINAYEKMFGKQYTKHKPLVSEKLIEEFPDIKIIKFPKDRMHKANIFATLGMSELACQDECLPEVYMYSYVDDDLPLKALSLLMEYVAENEVQPGKMFSGFADDSMSCSSILLAYPLPDGEGFPEIYTEAEKEIYFLWLLPVSEKEKIFIEKEGLDAFEDHLLENDPLYYGWDRKSVL